MLLFITKKILSVIPTFIGITLVAFFLIRLVPGDPIEVMMGERQMDPAQHAEMMHRMGLDLPLAEQYWVYLQKLVQGDFGVSLVSSRESDTARSHGLTLCGSVATPFGLVESSTR